jgi:hypothetical protein
MFAVFNFQGLHYLLLIAIVCDSHDQEKTANLVKVVAITLHWQP